MKFLIIVLLVFSILSMSLLKNAYAASPSNTTDTQVTASAPSNMSNTQVAASTMEQDNAEQENTDEAPVPKNPDAPKEAVKDFGKGVRTLFLATAFVVGICLLAIAL